MNTYPRSTMQAFRNTCEHACALERPYKHPADIWVKAALYAGAAAVAFVLAVEKFA